ncbi:MAG: cytochrome c3 family protein [Burkholderiaceae bacterium]
MKVFHQIFKHIASLALVAMLLPASHAVLAAPAAKAKPPTAEQKAPANADLGLAAIHREKFGMECQTCHGGTAAPDDNETVENKACVSCHGDYAKLGPATRAKLKNQEINPHASHLGPEIACTVCHQGHQESKAFCSNCHTNFVMPMPGNPAKR